MTNPDLDKTLIHHLVREHFRLSHVRRIFMGSGGCCRMKATTPMIPMAVLEPKCLCFVSKCSQDVPNLEAALNLRSC